MSELKNHFETIISKIREKKRKEKRESKTDRRRDEESIIDNLRTIRKRNKGVLAHRYVSFLLCNGGSESRPILLPMYAELVLGTT